eukprot:1119396-Pyramimonas_sp.AAC.1
MYVPLIEVGAAKGVTEDMIVGALNGIAADCFPTVLITRCWVQLAKLHADAGKCELALNCCVNGDRIPKALFDRAETSIKTKIQELVVAEVTIEILRKNDNVSNAQ